MEERQADKMPASAQHHDEHPKQQESPDEEVSSLSPTVARLVRESVASKPADGGKAAADGSSDILAFARSVDRVDSSLE
ncbi:hypothetical protein D1007_34839 [Hordeum vulgare]|uniref:Uncharacterized protein n=1 Tax=Hordeum vulgare subsp. vulgare TaxID=112509 RepID=A0A8I6X8X2_HORVV|nr:uncharacterized protein LOC123397271 [Hordeum vulgare subsp. vulgare]KAE8790844.1 hypothetical protein D1007_34839 [Hordeum vulgare]